MICRWRTAVLFHVYINSFSFLFLILNMERIKRQVDGIIQDDNNHKKQKLQNESNILKCVFNKF